MADMGGAHGELLSEREGARPSAGWPFSSLLCQALSRKAM